METTTEKDSHYNNLEKMPVMEILQNINKEDQTVAEAVKKALPALRRTYEDL